MTQGLIALDIDGTLTGRDHLVPHEVVDYLHHLFDEGWKIVLLTGRPLSYARHGIANFNFPFYLAVQNGADILEMPTGKLAQRSYLDMEAVYSIDKLHDEYLIYSGFEGGDFCYYQPKRFSQEMLKYLKKLEKLSNSPWQPIEHLDISQTHFPLIKCIGHRKDLEPVQQKLSECSNIAAALINDPVSDGFYDLILVNHVDATKGCALKRIQKYLGISGPVIAAGDDENDVPMLRVADIAIAMGTAPEHVLKEGDIIAPPATEMGIIPALTQAINE